MKPFSPHALFVTLLLLAPYGELQAGEQEICTYVDENSIIRQVEGRAAVPDSFQAVARCFVRPAAVRRAPPPMAPPRDIQLGPQFRTASLLTNIGTIDLRWPRSAESLFGRTPERAMADAARAVSRALRQSSFPPEVKGLRPDWQVVFMDADLPETQIPAYLRVNCHPGWMVPPGQIYIVAQRIAGVCQPGQQPRSSQVADAELSRVLIHEFGHAVEAAFFGGMIPPDRRRAEGFATWFESYAADFSSVIDRGRTRTEHLNMAAAVFPQAFSAQFGGSGHEYAAASLMFHAVVERRGTAGLARVYNSLSTDPTMNIFQAIQRETSWNERRFMNEMERVLEARN